MENYFKNWLMREAFYEVDIKFNNRGNSNSV